jgi:hypothetical protein
VGASIVAGVNSPPIHEPAEHVLDFVALSVKHAVMADLDLAFGL